MRALIDGDILRYEIGWGALTGWKAITETEEVPLFDYVEKLLLQRIASIQEATGSDEYCLYLTEGHTFRYDIATTKPYKGTRKENKPWHFDNLTAYMQGVLHCQTVSYIEADDALAIDALKDVESTVICTRDKDLRQVPVNVYSWELGKQASFGPLLVTDPGTLELTDGKLRGTGFAFFCAQMLMGDGVDNIPGVPKVGPVKAYEMLSDVMFDSHYAVIEVEDKMADLMNVVEDVYYEYYESEEWEERMLEQGQLCWVVRKLNDDGSPVMWERGMTE